MREDILKQRIMSLAEPIVRNLGLQIWGLELSPGKRPIIRLYIDTDLDNCATISRHLGLSLDVEDLLPHAYILEVSSPGLAREFFKLEQMQAFCGDLLEVKMPDAGKKCQSGVLESVGEDFFILKPAEVDECGEIVLLDLPLLRIDWQKVQRVKRVAVFQKPQKPGKKSAQGAIQRDSRRR